MDEIDFQTLCLYFPFGVDMYYKDGVKPCVSRLYKLQKVNSAIYINDAYIKHFKNTKLILDPIENIDDDFLRLLNHRYQVFSGLYLIDTITGERDPVNWKYSDLCIFLKNKIDIFNLIKSNKAVNIRKI